VWIAGEDCPDGEQIEQADLDILLARLPVIAAVAPTNPSGQRQLPGRLVAGAYSRYGIVQGVGGYRICPLAATEVRVGLHGCPLRVCPCRIGVTADSSGTMECN
jgi:hypothetical protein